MSTAVELLRRARSHVDAMASEFQDADDISLLAEIDLCLAQQPILPAADCCAIAIANARTRWRANGDLVAQEEAAEVLRLRAVETEARRLTTDLAAYMDCCALGLNPLDERVELHGRLKIFNAKATT
jgi:hypothetical protein